MSLGHQIDAGSCVSKKNIESRAPRGDTDLVEVADLGIGLRIDSKDFGPGSVAGIDPTLNAGFNSGSGSAICMVVSFKEYVSVWSV